MKATPPLQSAEEGKGIWEQTSGNQTRLGLDIGPLGKYILFEIMQNEGGEDRQYFLTVSDFSRY